MPKTQPIVITLVHGTWATDAAWTEKVSPLCKGLVEKLDNHELIFRQFKWTGRNRHSARLSAGRDLAQDLERVEQEFPGIPHIAITHSHGGNVALYALKHLGRTPPGFRLITLATPFLGFRKFDLSKVYLSLAVAACFLILGLVIGLYMSYGPPLMSLSKKWMAFLGPQKQTWWYLLGVIAGIFITLLETVGIWLLLLGLFGRTVMYLGQNRTDFIAYIDTQREELSVEGPSVPMLALIHGKDEIQVWLRGLGSAAGLVDRLYYQAVVVSRWLLRFWWVSFLLTLVAIIATKTISEEAGMTVLNSTNWLGGMIMLSLTAVVILSPFWLMGILLFSANPIVFGWEWKGRSFLVLPKLERTPAHLPTSVLLEPAAEPKRIAQLWHSVIYENEQVFERMVKFIRDV